MKEQPELKDKKEILNAETDANSKIEMELKLSEPLGISINLNKYQNISINIRKKLSLYDYLPKYEDNTSETDYYLYIKEFIKWNYLKIKETKPKNKYKFDNGQIEEIKKLITNINVLSERYEIIYRILIKKDTTNINNNKVIIYLGFNDVLNKYTFQINNSKSFLYEIIKYCFSENIDCYLKNPIEINHIEINPRKTLLISRFLYMIKDHDKEENPAQLFDLILPNYTPYKNNNKGNYYNQSYNSEDLFDNNTNSLNTDIKQYIAENNIKIIPLYANIYNDKKELIIFFKNLNYFQGQNYKTFSFLVLLEEKDKFPVTYLQVNYKLFKFIIKNPGISLTEFYEFCQENNIILYKKKN